nr:hypothetical protein [Saprospiraceae bacterium]
MKLVSSTANGMKFKQMKGLKFLVLSIALLISHAEDVRSQIVFGLTQNAIVKFDAQKPNIILERLAIDPLPDNQQISGMDFRPATGELYV